MISCEEITNGSGNFMHISLFSDLFEAICLRPDGLTDEIETHHIGGPKDFLLKSPQYREEFLLKSFSEFCGELLLESHSFMARPS